MTLGRPVSLFLGVAVLTLVGCRGGGDTSDGVGAEGPAYFTPSDLTTAWGTGELSLAFREGYEGSIDDLLASAKSSLRLVEYDSLVEVPVELETDAAAPDPRIRVVPTRPLEPVWHALVVDDISGVKLGLPGEERLGGYRARFNPVSAPTLIDFSVCGGDGRIRVSEVVAPPEGQTLSEFLGIQDKAEQACFVSVDGSTLRFSCPSPVVTGYTVKLGAGLVSADGVPLKTWGGEDTLDSKLTLGQLSPIGGGCLGYRLD